MALMNVFIAVVLCTLGYSESFNLRKVAEGLTSRQLRRSDDLVLPTVSPALNPGDAGVQEWPDEFRPDIMSAFELLKSKREAQEGGENPPPSGGGSNPWGSLPFVPPQVGEYAKPFTSNNYTDMSQLTQYQQNFTSMMGNNSQFTQFPGANAMPNITGYIPPNPMESYNTTNFIPNGNMPNITSYIPPNPMESYNTTNFIPNGNMPNMTSFTSYNPMANLSNTNFIPNTNMSNYVPSNPITNMNTTNTNFIPGGNYGNVPFLNQNNNGNNNPEGEKPSKRSADFFSQMPAVDYKESTK